MKRTIVSKSVGCAAAAALALAGAAGANPINLGNLVVTNNVSTQNLTGLTGGTYNRVTFTTNWSYNAGMPTSMGAAFNFNAGSFSNIIASLSSATGFANNANSTTLTAVCNLSVPVSSSTALMMIRAQNTFSNYAVANWSNTVLTFSNAPRIRPIPTGIREMGIRGTTFSPMRIIAGGGGSGGSAGGFSPSVGVYSSEGFLMASNVGAAGAAGNPDPGLDGLIMPEGTYYMFVGGAGTRFAMEDFGVDVPRDAVGGKISGMVGSGGWIDTTLEDGTGHWYSFSMVPAPGTAALVGAGVIVAGRRRRA